MATAAAAYTELEFDPAPVVLSTGTPGQADKVRLTGLANGTLIAAWTDASGPDGGAWSIDGSPIAPRDIFVSTSTDGGATWSAVMNVSNTATLTDVATFYDRIGDGTGLANYYGDSGKPSVFASGNRIAIAWDDAYCGPGRKGPALYSGPQGAIEVPFHCLYVARLIESSGALSLVRTDQVSDATRDSDNEVIRAAGEGFAVVWQEDPQGLQPGEAAGEGDGASGARVTPGTDIWYTALAANSFADPLAPWTAPLPISDNYDYGSATILGGGSSRPALAIAGSPAVALVAYEESKNSGPGDPGKYVRYHMFPFSSPVASAPGTIVSDPAENARRVRVLAQGTPGSTYGTRALLLWRQGGGIQGAPAAVFSRVGRVPAGIDVASTVTAGFRVEDLWPTVDTADPFANQPGLNLSGDSLTDASGASPGRDAKAHRATLDGDFIYAGYTQNDDVADPLSTYRYLLRTSGDGGSSWMLPADVSTPDSTGADVIEPRLMRTPATRPTGRPEDIRDPDTYVAAWGTEDAPSGTSVPLARNLLVTRTADRGLTFERTQSLSGSDPNATDEAIQMQLTPDGRRVFAVWIRRDAAGSHALFSTATVIDRTADLSIVGTTGQNEVYLDTDFPIEFHIVNSGPDTATATQIQFAVDGGLTVLSVEPSVGNCTIGTLTCELGPLLAGATADVVLTVLATSRGDSDVRATISAPETEPAPADNNTVVAVSLLARADLSFRLQATRPTLPPDSELGIVITVVNSGPQSANEVMARLRLPRTMTVTSVPPLCQSAHGFVECAIDSLAVGQQWLTILPVATTVAGTVVASGTVVSADTDPFEQDNSSSATIAVVSAGPGGGCVYRPGQGVDPVLPTLLLTSLAGLILRRRLSTDG